IKVINIVLSFVLIMGITSCASSGKTKTTKTQDEGWVSIFDGKTTTGWRGYNKTTFPEKGWEVVDGTLHCIGSGAGEAGGDIIYDKKLSNFELELEWKISEGGNSGIFLLGQEFLGETINKSAPALMIFHIQR